MKKSYKCNYRNLFKNNNRNILFSPSGETSAIEGAGVDSGAREGGTSPGEPGPALQCVYRPARRGNLQPV